MMDEETPLNTVNELYLKHGPERSPCSDETLGMWILTYDNQNVNEAWRKAKKLFDTDQLTGVDYIWASTSMNNPMATNPNGKSIMYFCGPWHEKDNMESIGSNLVKKMDRTRQSSDHTQYVYYKTAQTRKELYKVIGY